METPRWEFGFDGASFETFEQQGLWSLVGLGLNLGFTRLLLNVDKLCNLGESSYL